MSITTFPDWKSDYSRLIFSILLATSTFAETKKLDSVGLTVGDLGNPFFVQIAHGAEQKAKQINGKVKFTDLSSNYDVNNQTNQIDNFISSNVNLILLGAADSKGIAPAVMRAKQAGITVVAVDVGAEGGVDATVTSNNKQAGTKDGAYVAERLKGRVKLSLSTALRSPQSVIGWLAFWRRSRNIRILRSFPKTKTQGAAVMEGFGS